MTAATHKGRCIYTLSTDIPAYVGTPFFTQSDT